MTEKKNAEREALDRLADSLVDDILNASDDDILDEFRESEGDPGEYAARMRTRFEDTVVTANKQRLAAAKAGAEAHRSKRGEQTAPIDFAEARRRLRAVLDTPNAPQHLTLAARKESELSDADVASMLDDLRDFGIPPADDVREGTS